MSVMEFSQTTHGEHQKCQAMKNFILSPPQTPFLLFHSKKLDFFFNNMVHKKAVREVLGELANWGKTTD